MVSIRALRSDDDRASFQSGNDELDRFFHRHAGSNQFVEHIGATYVAVDHHEKILGFVTLAGATVTTDSFASTRKRRLPRYPLPALRLARLAVRRESQKKGIGTLLIRYAFAQALETASRIGGVGVLVDAKPEAVQFYERLGFELSDALEGRIASHPEPAPMFLPLSLVKAAIGG